MLFPTSTTTKGLPLAAGLATVFLGQVVSSTVIPEGLVARDSNTGRCGSGFSNLSCNSFGTNNKCCSQYGWCGDSVDHCGTGCQSSFGNCNGGTTPTTTATTPNPTTSVGARPLNGAVPYGSQILDCTAPGVIALTFDDGPYVYTSQLLDILDAKGVKATFFITGNNLEKGAIDVESNGWAAIIRRAYNAGHQIASHTWDHPDMDTLSEGDREFQMTRLETALKTIIGRYPTYMRPPYIRCGDACQATMLRLGYHTIIWDLDTDDYNNDSPTLIQNSKNNVRNALQGTDPSTTDFMSIAHDIHQQTVINLTSYQIDFGVQAGYRHVTLGECLGDPVENWYRL